MFNDYDVTPPKTRTIELENGNKLNLTRTDPYGAIVLSLERGQLPEAFRGSYTDWYQAEIAAHKYVLERQSVVAELKEKEPKKKAG